MLEKYFEFEFWISVKIRSRYCFIVKFKAAVWQLLLHIAIGNMCFPRQVLFVISLFPSQLLHSATCIDSMLLIYTWPNRKNHMIYPVYWGVRQCKYWFLLASSLANRCRNIHVNKYHCFFSGIVEFRTSSHT